MFSGNRNLEYFLSNKNFRRPQARLVEYLFCFNFQFIYKLGIKNRKPDELTRRSRDLPSEEYEQYQNILAMIKP